LSNKIGTEICPWQMLRLTYEERDDERLDDGVCRNAIRKGKTIAIT
jgi:hypothetical protein